MRESDPGTEVYGDFNGKYDRHEIVTLGDPQRRTLRTTRRAPLVVQRLDERHLIAGGQMGTQVLLGIGRRLGTAELAGQLAR